MSGPLAGVKVLDLGLAAVGPWAAMLMGALGADVLKIEAPSGDATMVMVPPLQRGRGVVYTHCNLNKRAAVLDLKQPADLAIVHRLVKHADVLIENMRPGTAERLGIGYGTLRELNPRLIYASASAWGRRGPMHDQPGGDPSVQAFCGWSSITGVPELPGEQFRHFGHLDVNTSCYIVAAILQALLLRERTGAGMRVDVTMLGAAVNLQITRLAEFFATGRQPERMGSGCATTVPHQAFLCCDRQWLAVGVVNDEQWQGLVRALGPGEFTDERFATNRLRVENRDRLVPLLAERFGRYPTTCWSIRLAREGVPCSPFLAFRELRDHIHVRDSGSIIPIDIPHQGRILFGGLPWHFSRTPGQLLPAPEPGAHTAAVRQEAAETS
jgi:crotonobetainyl-CoA:carnitine CoA-transferase CaiB-like acyl-CoA transferase